MVFRELVPFRKVRPNVVIRNGADDSPLMTLQRRMNRMFDDFFTDFDDLAPVPFRGMRTAHFTPRIDVAENDKEYTLTAELAGIDEKDVEISVVDNVLTISGEKKTEREEKDAKCCLTERSYGKFSRSVALGEEVDQDNIDASFKKGILTVHLPKIPEPKVEPKKIEIKSE